MSTDYSAYATTTTHLSSAKRTLWETKLLKKALEYLVAPKFATTRVLGPGEAGTLRLNKLLRAARQTTQDTEGYAYGIADAKHFVSNYIDVTPEKWGDSFVWTDDTEMETFIKQPDKMDEVADQMARTLEHRFQQLIATQCMRLPIDLSTSAIAAGTVAAADATTVTLETTAIDFNGGFLTMTNAEGPAYDESHQITAFNTSTEVATATFTNTPTTASKYWAATGATMTGTDYMSTNGLLVAAYLHRKLGTEVFPNGTLHGFMHAEQEYDLWKNDTLWQDTAKYVEAARYRNYKLVRWLGNEFLIGSELHREDIDGTSNDAGAVYVAPIFGQKAYSIVHWGLKMGSFKGYPVKFVYKDGPDSADLRDNFRGISWKSKVVCHVQRATSCLGVMTGVGAPTVYI